MTQKKGPMMQIDYLHTVETKSNYLQNLILAWRDCYHAVREYPLWSMMGWQDIKQRYRRSLLGPTWITISMAVLILTLSLVWGGLFNQDMSVYLPYLTSGLVAWNLISVSMVESCSVFIDSTGYLKQIKLPYFLFILRVGWRNFIIFLHTMILPIIVIVYYHQTLNWNILCLIPGLILIFMNNLWMGILLGMLSTRYRDVTPIVSAMLQPLFYITPIIWQTSQIHSVPVQWIIELNPFNYFIEMIRLPFLGQAIPFSCLKICISIIFSGWIVSFLLFSKFRKKITYWL